ncbi:MAG: CBS domain-containing protein [Acidobacteriota bacterium]
MTHNYAIILPLMIANIISYALATELNPTPIYDALLLQDGIRLPHTETQVLKRLTVGAVMTRNVTTVSSELTAAQAFEYVQTLPQLHRAYPLLDPAGRLAGLITYNDLKRTLAAGQSDRRLDELSSKKLIQAHPENTLQMVVLKLGRKGFMRIPVVSRQDPTKLFGIITMHDIAAALAEEDDEADLSHTTEELRIGQKEGV